MTRDRQKARTENMVKSLCIDVVSALDDYQSWATAASDSGRVTPVQFLAVVLWAISAKQGRNLNESEVAVLVSKWWQRLVDATVKRVATLGGSGPLRHLYPYDSLTLLEFEQNKVTAPQGWCLRIDDADDWLSSNGAGTWCASFFEACGSRGLAGSAPAIAIEWTGEKLAAQVALYKAQGYRDYTKRTSQLASISERDVRRLVSAHGDSKSSAGSINSVFEMGKKIQKKPAKRA